MNGDGGPAFPGVQIYQDFTQERGMSLRDWFAGQALAGAVDFSGFTNDMAKQAYELADAMLEERAKSAQGKKEESQ